MKYLILLLTVICTPLMAQNELNSKFGNKGKVKDSLTGSSSYQIEEFELYNDNIYAVVSLTGVNRVGVVSYDLAGNPNTSFSQDGKLVYSNYSSAPSRPRIAMSANGDIYIVSCSTFVLEVVKFSLDGTLDTQFGVNGKMSFFGHGGQLAGAEIRGNTLMVGCSYGVNAFVVKIDLTKKALDASFGSGGKASISYVNDSPYMYGMTVDNNNNVYLFGYITYFSGGNYAAIGKFNSKGVDSTFGINGLVNGPQYANYCIGKVSGSTIYAAGGGTQDGIVSAHRTSDGSLVGDFSNTGTHITGGSNNRSESLNSLIMLSNGNLLAAGSSMDYITYDQNAYFVQLSPSGAPILEYGVDGVFMDDTPGENESIYCMAEVNGYDVISSGYSGSRYFLSYLYEETATPEFPQAFSPNNDGHNDYLLIRNIYAAANNTLTVYDREGNKVFEQSNYDNTWNGLNNNEKPLSDGIYYYVFKYDGTKKIKNFLEIRR